MFYAKLNMFYMLISVFSYWEMTVQNERECSKQSTGHTSTEIIFFIQVFKEYFTKCLCLHSTWIQCIQILLVLSAPNINIWIKHIVQTEKYWKRDRKERHPLPEWKVVALNAEEMVPHLQLGVKPAKKE